MASASREEVLIYESTAPVQLGPGCKVLAGEWDDRYTGRRVTNPPAPRTFVTPATPTRNGRFGLSERDL